MVGAFKGAFLATSAVKARTMAVVTTSEKTLTMQPEIRKVADVSLPGLAELLILKRCET
jgi:hypothetical protein